MKPSDPKVLAERERKKKFITDQLSSLRDAYMQCYPDDQFVVCAKVLMNNPGEEDQSFCTFSHSSIEEKELALAIYDWSYIIHLPTDDESPFDSWASKPE